MTKPNTFGAGQWLLDQPDALSSMLESSPNFDIHALHGSWQKELPLYPPSPTLLVICHRGT